MKKFSLPLIFIFLLIFSSCVYYNTFFNAKKYYAEALKAKERNNNEINKNISDKFNTTIGKCAYILKWYPKNKWAANALLLMGKCFYEQGNYIKAQIKFEEFEEYYPNNKLFPEAKLYLAKTHLQLREFEEAEKTFNTIFFDDIFSDVRDDAYFGYAQFYFKKNNYTRANEILSELLEQKISKTTENKALSLKGTLNFHLNNYNISKNVFDKILKNDPTKNEKLDAKLFIARCLIAEKNHKKAHEILDKLAEDETRKESLHKINLYNGFCKAYLGNTEKSFEMFKQLKNGNSGKPLVSLINYYWGDVFFSILNDYQNAIDKFNSVQEKHVQKNIFKDCSVKLKISTSFIEINDLQEQNKFSQIADKQFIIAEYYNFDLNIPDSAISIYNNITENYFLYKNRLDSMQIIYDSLFVNSYPIPLTDSTLTDSSISLQDSTLQNGKQDTLLTYQIPDSTFFLPDSTQIATDSLKLPDTTKTVMDSIPNAKEAHMSKREFQENIDKLQHIIAQYDSIIHPKNLFMKFWTLLKLSNDSLSSIIILDSMKINYPESKFTLSATKITKNESYEDILFPKDPAEDLFLSSLSSYYDDADTLKMFTILDSLINYYPESSFYPKALYFKSIILLKHFADTSQAKPHLFELKKNFADAEFVNEISTYFDGENYIFPKIASTTDTTKTIEPTQIFNTTIQDSVNFPDSSNNFYKSEIDSLQEGSIIIPDSTENIEKE
ncbi:MAG: tetratricopeptide repeat protein [Candidatus Cloacimonadota bacterium]|nr:tetratricopeptide repeat protein [Candidatus Cloacimonadota bacterium]